MRPPDADPRPHGARLDGKLAVVTGGARGIGRAICERLVAETAAVALIDRDGRELRKLKDDMPLAGTYEADIASEGDIDAAFATIERECGHPDILINNAAYLDSFGTLLDTQPEEWEAAIAGTLTSVYRCSRRVLPGMIDRRKGTLVNVASVGAICGFAEMAAYTSAKAGVVQLTKAIAIDYGPFGVRANAVSPGAVRTTNNLLFASDAKLIHQAEMSVLGRLAEPYEIAAVVAFLASDDASFVTGANVVVDGGWTLR